MSLTFDNVISETHDFTVTTTDHPVEKGINISDNIRQDPVMFTAECLVTNTPIVTSPTGGPGNDGSWRQVDLHLPPPKPPLSPAEVVDLTGGLVGAAIGSLLGTTPSIPGKALVLGFDTPRDYVVSVIETMKQARLDGVLFHVATPRGEYDNMVMMKFTAPKSADDGDACSFRLEFKEIRIVEVRRVPTPVLATAKKVTSKGDKPTDAPKEEVKKSILKAGNDGLGNPLNIRSTSFR
jgi:hypothetical protein